METAEKIFKFRKTLYRLTGVKFDTFAVNGIWYRIENWESVDEQG